MTEFLKKYWVFLLLIVIAISFIIYQQFELHQKKSIIYYQDSIMVIDSTKYSVLAQEYQNEKDAIADLERYAKGLAEVIDSKNEKIRTYEQVIIKLKNQVYTYIDTVEVFQVINDTILVPIGDDMVNIDIENSLYKVNGTTYLYPRKGYTIYFEGKPITLDIVIAEDKNGVYNSYIETNNPDLELVDFKTRFLKEPKSFWSELYGITSLGVTNKNVLFDLGIGYNKFGIKGIVGFDYQEYSISKNNVIYGLGLTYKIF